MTTLNSRAFAAPFIPVATIALLLAVVFSIIPSRLDAQGLPPYADLRGTYKGLGRIVVTTASSNRRQILSGQTTVGIRLRNKGRKLSVRMNGRYENDQGPGQMSGRYLFANNGSAAFTFEESVTRSRATGRGTGNLRRTSVRFTLVGTAYGQRGTFNGTIRASSRTLRLSQTFQANNGNRVTWTIIAPKRGR